MPFLSVFCFARQTHQNMNREPFVHSITEAEKVGDTSAFGRDETSRLCTLRRALAVLAAAPMTAISGQGCPEKADLRLDGA